MKLRVKPDTITFEEFRKYVNDMYERQKTTYDNMNEYGKKIEFDPDMFNLETWHIIGATYSMVEYIKMAMDKVQL